MRSTGGPILPYFLFVLLLPLPLAGASLGEGAGGPGSTAIRDLAYGKSGEWLFESLDRMSPPPFKPFPPGERPFDLPVDWKRQSKDLGRTLPLAGSGYWTYEDPSHPVTVRAACFRTRYLEGGSRLFDDYFHGVRTSPLLKEQQRSEILRNEALQRERSTVLFLSYDSAQVQVLYYPGRLRFKGGARSRAKDWLPRTPEGIRSGTRKDFSLIGDTRGLLGIFNGTFDTLDNFVHWRDGEAMRYGGFGYGGGTYMDAQPGMATFALYQNGRVRLGAYRDLPAKEKILSFIQNRYMVLEDGALAKDSDPSAFCSFYDNIARSYLFTGRDGRIGYLWSLYTPAPVLARIAQGMGIRDMMLLDIHSPVSCTLSAPDHGLRFGSYKDYMEHSFDWVPNFYRMGSLGSTLVWLSQALRSRIQTHYVLEAFQGGSESYFALFRKGSPEVRRALAPEPGPGPAKLPLGTAP